MSQPRLSWLVIGVGDITSKRVIPAILEESRSSLYAILTRHPEKAKPYHTKVFTDLDEALRDEEINAVYVASPVFLHAPQTLAALRAGRHVLCEKPLAMNFAEAESMVQAAQTAGKVFGVAYYRRHYPKLLRAIELMQRGVIGQPLLAYISCHGGIPGKPGHRGWLVEPDKAGGGPLYDVASHRIDVLNFCFGEPARVRAVIGNDVHQLQVEDSATVVVEYKSKVRGIADVRWNSSVPRDEFRIVGTGGEMELSPLNGPSLVTPGGREELPVHRNVHLPLIQNFVAAVLDGAPLLSSGASARWTDWVTAQALADSRRPS